MQRSDSSEADRENSDETALRIVRESARLANHWGGKTITISGRGGYVCCEGSPRTDDIVMIKTDDDDDHISKVQLDVVKAEAEMNMPGAVAFRIAETNKYLTHALYGDAARQLVAESLESIRRLPIDCIPIVVDYLVDIPTDESNFEGAGFNYLLMTATDGPPSRFQWFMLEYADEHRLNCMGVKSLFGKYWRSQWWDKVISRSPHLLGDESWNFTELRRPNKKKTRQKKYKEPRRNRKQTQHNTNRHRHGT